MNNSLTRDQIISWSIGASLLMAMGLVIWVQLRLGARLDIAPSEVQQNVSNLQDELHAFEKRWDQQLRDSFGRVSPEDVKKQVEQLDHELALIRQLLEVKTDDRFRGRDARDLIEQLEEKLQIEIEWEL